jgi:hypothetical protein
VLQGQYSQKTIRLNLSLFSFLLDSFVQSAPESVRAASSYPRFVEAGIRMRDELERLVGIEDTAVREHMEMKAREYLENDLSPMKGGVRATDRQGPQDKSGNGGDLWEEEG